MTDLAPDQVDEEWQPLVVTPCPVCKKDIDAATHVSDQAIRPRAGDFSLCLYCATPLVFSKKKNGLGLRLPNKSEWAEVQKIQDMAVTRMLAIKLIHERAVKEQGDD